MGGLLRYQVFLGYGILFVAVWYASLEKKEWIVSTLPISTEGADLLINYAPVWLVVGLGVYALLTIVLRVANFSDCPDAAAEVEAQAKEAVVEMKKMGVMF